MDRVSLKSYTPIAGTQLRPASESASHFNRLSAAKIESPSTSGQSPQTTKSVFKQATSLLQEPNLQKKNFFSRFSSKSKAEYSLTKAENKKSLEKIEGIQIRSLNVSKPHINKLNQDLEVNLKLATRIAGEVSQAVPYSTNALESGRVYYKGPPIRTITDSTRQQIFVPHRPPLNGAYSEQRELVEQASKTWDDYFQRTEKACQQSGMGNCVELAAMACKRLKDSGANHVDYIIVTDLKTDNTVIPHRFAVVGRTTSEDDSGISVQHFFSGQLSRVRNLGLPNQWNDSAVICDPWARNAYPAKDFDQFWDNLKSYCDSPATLTCGLLHRLPET